MEEARRAQLYFGLCFQEYARMGCHLTPNAHIVMHLEDYIRLYGPVYGWWAYAFERMNGILGRFNTNGHTGGEVEATILRGWLKTIQLQDLVREFCLLSRMFTELDLARSHAISTGEDGGRSCHYQYAS